MTDRSASPYQVTPPTASALRRSVLVAVLLAALVLVLAVLPAEYGIDPTGVGTRLGFTRLNGEVTSINIGDPLSGNQSLASGAGATPADPGQPLPLPNPAVYQAKNAAARTDTLSIQLPAGGETEVKTVLSENQVVLYHWQTDRGVVYVDYHGHSPSWPNQEAFVRYQEAQDGVASASGSLVAPFTGEHGWYWVNINDFPVTITLTVQGYYDELKNYGVHSPP